MPRRARIVLPGQPHHVTQRGNNRRDVFFCDQDRRIYLSLLREYCALYSLRVTGFCLMTNHIHLIATPENQTSLARALGRTHNDYARYLNTQRRESGHVWQNRFFSCPLENAYTWAALAYVERNPVRAGLAEQSEAWQWSSARARVCADHTDAEWLDQAHWSKCWTPKLWRVALEEGLLEAEIEARLREATLGGRPLGDASFLEDCERRLQRPVQRQKPGPKKHSRDADVAIGSCPMSFAV